MGNQRIILLDFISAAIRCFAFEMWLSGQIKSWLQHKLSIRRHISASIMGSLVIINSRRLNVYRLTQHAWWSPFRSIALIPTYIHTIYISPFSIPIAIPSAAVNAVNIINGKRLRPNGSQSLRAMTRSYATDCEDDDDYFDDDGRWRWWWRWWPIAPVVISPHNYTKYVNERRRCQRLTLTLASFLGVLHREKKQGEN